MEAQPQNQQQTSKRRGRPPKYKSESGIPDIPVVNTPVIPSNTLVKPEKKKRGRKATIKCFDSDIRKKIPLDIKNTINNNLDEILEIDISANSITNTISNLSSNSATCKTIKSVLNNEKYTVFKPETNTSLKSNGVIKMYTDDFLKEWPNSTDIHCWWCCHRFPSIPIGLPVSYMKSKDAYRVQGIFCSFECMTSYADELKLDKKFIRDLLYKLTARSIVRLADLPKAPPRCTLRMFGGELGIDEFRKNSVSKVYKMVNYPMFISNDYISEIDVLKVKSINKGFLTDKSPLNQRKMITGNTTVKSSNSKGIIEMLKNKTEK